MKCNLFDDWKDFILKEKWEKGLMSEPIFKKVETIYQTLTEFFPQKDFDRKNFKKENWLAYILASKNLSSLFQLNEIYELINYFNGLDEPEQNAFRLRIKKDNSINYKEFRNILFEIFVNYHLYNSGLNPKCTDSYLNEKGASKPLDSSFIFNNKKYIIECTKVYSAKFEAFWEFANRIALKFKNRGIKQKIYTDEMVSGYIGLKTDKNLKTNLNQAEQEFNKLLKKYFHSFNDKNKEFIQLFEPVENENYVVCVEPDFLNKYENEYSNLPSKFDYYLKFQTRATNIIQGIAKANIFIHITHKKVSQFISQKVKEKIKQHKSSSAHRIIFIEIENTQIVHKDGYSIPLTKDNLDINEFTNLINNRTSIVFILKNITNSELKYNIGFLKNSQFDRDLSTKIEQLLN